MKSSNSTPRLRHKVVDVTSVEHARAVIRGMRSTLHSKVNYQRSACRDDQIMSNIEEFDHLVVKKAFEVQEINRIDNLLNTIPIPKITSDIPNKQSSKPPQLSPDDKDDMSSDEDELDRKIQSGIIEQEQPENPDVESTLYMEGGKAHHTHARKKIEASQLPKKAQRQNLKDTGDSSDEEFLKKLAQDDDEDDMAELFKGFVGPKKVQQTSNTSKSYMASAMSEVNSSDEESELIFHGSTHRVSRSAGDESPMKSGKSKKLIPATNSPVTIRTQSASDTREVNLPSSNFKKSSIQPGLNTQPRSQEKPLPKHQVMVTPGQRIRVRPSRKQRNPNDGNV